MNTQTQNKKAVLKEKVVDLVKDFMKTEGGITQNDLKELLGEWPYQEVAAALANLPISLT